MEQRHWIIAGVVLAAVFLIGLSAVQNHDVVSTDPAPMAAAASASPPSPASPARTPSATR
jgi:hypothetical protein